MKKILASVLVISTVATVGYLGTKAYFSDTETSTGNVLSAGTIDISVDDQNPWSKTYTEAITDMKPGAHAKEITFVIKNEGQNPVNVWKRIDVTDRSTGTESEPECTEQLGVWDNVAKACDWDGSGTLYVDKNDMDTQIVYSMTVDTTDLIKEDWDVKMSDIDGLWIPVKTLDVGLSETVTQDYLLDELAGNEYQGDELTFTITLYAEQYMGPGPSHTANGVVLENKSGDPHWTPMIDDTWGLLTWDALGNYRLRAWNLAGTKYQLQGWDAVNDLTLGMFGPEYTTANVDDAGTHLALTTDSNAKYWLRDTATWSQILTLWEANQVN